MHIPCPAQGGQGLDGLELEVRGLGGKGQEVVLGTPGPTGSIAIAFSHVSFVLYHLMTLILICQPLGVWRKKAISAYDPVYKK